MPSKLFVAGEVLTASQLNTELADLQVFTAGGTWTKPAGARTVHVICIGGGAGGGSGRQGAAGGGRSGGGGGGAGSIVEAEFRASDLSGTETVTIGTGGPGGAGQASTSSDGNAGTAGVDTTFGSRVGAAGCT